LIDLNLICSANNTCHVTMSSKSKSFSSRPEKVKPKGSVRELKLVQTVSRKGKNIIKTEEVKTSKHQLGTPSKSQQISSSPFKRQKTSDFDEEPIPFDLDVGDSQDSQKKRQTLVFLIYIDELTMSDNLQGQNDFLKQFLGHEKSYLNHLLNLEIRPTCVKCTECGLVEGSFRCSDCYGSHWWCQSCIVKLHTLHPFHRPQQWRKDSFENVSLSDLGYVFKLGHSISGRSCPDEDDLFGDRKMTLIHVNGVFEHCIRFCRCHGASSEHEQLFLHRLFPSSFDRPQTAFTMDVLDYFGIDAMECKTSAQSFFQKLRRVTNNAFPDEVPVS
jgi:hypothetical protein